MSSLDEIGRGVRAIIATSLSRPVEQVPDDAKLESGLGIDSMAMIEINVAIEEKFKLAMPDMAVPSEANLVTVQDLVKLVARELDKQQGKKAS
jgi:acyl carrier protein